MPHGKSGKKVDNQFGEFVDRTANTGAQTASLKGSRAGMADIGKETFKTTGKGTGDPKGDATARIIQGSGAMPLNKKR